MVLEHCTSQGINGIAMNLSYTFTTVRTVRRMVTALTVAENSGPAELRAKEGGTVVIQDCDLNSFCLPNKQN